MSSVITPSNTISQGLIVSQFSGQVYTKSLTGVDPVTSILTYPTEDYAGDLVRPDGGDWSRYPEHPYVNWAHKCPIGRGSVSHNTLKYNGETSRVAVGRTTFLYTKADVDGLDLRRRDPRTHRSWDKEPPYTVDEVLKASAQAERLIRDEIATGVSIEFDTNPEKQGIDWWDLGKQSLLENRPARHFENWRGLGYAHARQPVNPGCLTLAGQPRLTTNPETIEKAIRIAQTGKLPGGESACDIILKSFSDLKDYRSPRTSVLIDTAPPTSQPLVIKAGAMQKWISAKIEKIMKEGVRGKKVDNKQAAAIAYSMYRNRKKGKMMAKALDDAIDVNTITNPTVIIEPTNPNPSSTVATPNPAQTVTIIKGDTLEGMSSSPGESKGMGAGHRAMMNAVQMLHDVCQSLEEEGMESDDLSIRKFCKKVCAKIEDMAGDIKARAEKHRAKLDGAEDDEDAMDEDDYEPTKEEKAIQTREDGSIIVKGFPDWKPRRMTFKDLVQEPVVTVSTEPAPTKAEIKAMKKASRETENAVNTFNKAVADLQAFLVAAKHNGKI